jgi:RimJ/RimL family protein N-acetyltransferase
MTAKSVPLVGTNNVIELCDGTEAVVRHISPTDADALMRFHSHLSARSIQLRYFYPHLDLGTGELAHFTQVDGVARVALVVERANELIAVGRYDRFDDHTTAEVAFVVADAYQHQGLATMLLHQLVDRARRVGITRLVAEVLAENGAMLSVFRNAGLPIQFKTEWGVVLLTMTIGPDLEGSGELSHGHTPEQPGPGVLGGPNLEAPA